MVVDKIYPKDDILASVYTVLGHRIGFKKTAVFLA